jgi:hypothetical protein
MKPVSQFDHWQRRVLGVLIPALLMGLLILDATDSTGLNSPYTPLLLVLLVSYGSGLSAYVLKRWVGGAKDDETDDKS